MNPAANDLAKTDYPTKASLVEVLKSATDDAVTELKKQSGEPGAKHTSMALSFIAHSSEHYGQLVLYYRLNNLTPSASRR